MIIEWAMGLIGNLSAWFFLFLPPVDDLESAPDAIAAAMAPIDSALTGLGGWVPWGVLSGMAIMTFTFWGLALVVRVVKSFLPGMSG